MNYHVLTLFPEMIRDGMNTSITGRAMAKGLLSLNTINIRDYSVTGNGRIDDYPYGGGAGMVMQAEPVMRAYEDLIRQIAERDAEVYTEDSSEDSACAEDSITADSMTEDSVAVYSMTEDEAELSGQDSADLDETEYSGIDNADFDIEDILRLDGAEAADLMRDTLETDCDVQLESERSGVSDVQESDMQDESETKDNKKIRKQPRLIYLTPQGRVFHQRMAEEFAKEEDLIFLCGHYEGIDERVLEEIVTDYVSIGDYVLTGGELPAMVMMDAISRMVPGVLSNQESGETESFQGNLLEYPQYSRPEDWRGKKVPPVLMSGHHGNVDRWRRDQSILRTLHTRPELLAGVEFDKKDRKFLQALANGKLEYELTEEERELIKKLACQPGAKKKTTNLEQ